MAHAQPTLQQCVLHGPHADTDLARGLQIHTPHVYHLPRCRRPKLRSQVGAADLDVVDHHEELSMKGHRGQPFDSEGNVENASLGRLECGAAVEAVYFRHMPYVRCEHLGGFEVERCRIEARDVPFDAKPSTADRGGDCSGGSDGGGDESLTGGMKDEIFHQDVRTAKGTRRSVPRGLAAQDR